MSSNWYNLAFRDIFENMVINDFTVSNNMDTAKALTTIFRILKYYLELFPDRIVYFTGSTDVRMQLYRMAISKYVKELKGIFYIFGVSDKGEMRPFCKNVDYIYILVSLKRLS